MQSALSQQKSNVTKKKKKMLRRSSTFLSSFSPQSKNFVKIIECPRDAIQGLKDFIPTDKKINYLKKLLCVGYDSLDCVSFVPAKIMPQLADSEEVTKEIGPWSKNPLANPKKTKLLAVVANVKGAKTACSFEDITTVGYPLSASETFQQRNTKRSIAEALVDIAEIQKVCDEHKKQLGVCISMAFGNPYGENVTGETVRELCEKLVKLNVPVIYFADTVGSGTPEYIAQVFQEATRGLLDQKEFGIHLHSMPGQEAEEKLEAVMSVGCRRFDGALCSLGGCPFAKSDLVGNIDSEAIVRVTNRLGLQHNIDVEQQLAAKEELMEMLPFLRKRVL
jgi:hydroxymethylglutaryl-CoA lyase